MESDWTTTSALAFGSVLVLYLGQRAFRRRTPYPLPPGPPGIPWVGNIIGVDASTPWITYTEWAKTYGDIVYSRLFGTDIIILNSDKTARDLLEGRSKNYSDRPLFATSELCGLDYSSAFLPYGDQWRLHRRFFHQTFRPDAVHRFRPAQHRQACNLLRQLLDSPEQLENHAFGYTATVIMNSTYSYDNVSRNDKLIEIVANALAIVVPVMRPDITIMLGAFPWLLYLPSWFPGMSFKKEFAIAREYSKVYLDRPFEYALEKETTDSSVSPSMVHDALQELEEKGVSPDESLMKNLKQASGTAFLSASETSNATFMLFILVMVMHLEVQEKIHAEINAVVGRDRLPTLDDRPSLPYLDAVIREMHRWCPIAPLSMPHATTEDDVYEGFYIPKGATILTNQWAIAHDESKYPDSHTFKPDRFLNEDGSLKPSDVDNIMFGYGRRMCIGRHFADTTLWTAMVRVLAVYKILKSLDDNGKEIPVELKFASGLVVHPLPFKCRIVPRSEGMDAEKLEKLIAASTP